MKTIAPEIIRCKVHADIVHLEEVAIRPGLAVQHKRPHRSFASEPGNFHHMFNAAQGVFALTYYCKRDCITFLFDAWSATTRDHLVRARDQGGLLITLLGKEGPTRVGGGSHEYWVDAVSALDEFRIKHAPRSLLEFVGTNVILLAMAYGIAPGVLTDTATSGPSATSVLMLLDRGHVAARTAAGP